MNLLRIALLTNGIFPFDIGGIQKHSYFLTKYLAKEKVYVDVYHPGGDDNQNTNIQNYYSPEELQYLNFTKIDFPSTISFPGHYVYASWLFSKKLYAELEKEKKYNCIYAQGFTSWYFLRKKAFRKDLISNLHGLEMFQTSINIKNKLEQFLLKIPAKQIIKQSALQVSLGGKLTNILYSRGAEKDTVVEIPNGINKSWIIEGKHLQKQDINKTIRFIFVGRYERRKGIEEINQVIQEKMQNKNFSFTFIGNIPHEKQIQHSFIDYIGIIKEQDIIQLELTSSDILVCPSYSEGMPTVILEAMACGCAIIATDVGAVNTMLDVSNGWLISPKNIKSGLKQAMNEAIALDKNELVQKKANSVQKVKENFTWDLVIEKTIREIKKCSNT